MDACCIQRNWNLRSYHNFLCRYEKDYRIRLNSLECRFIEFISQKLAEGKRSQELLLLKNLLRGREEHLYSALAEELGYRPGTCLNKESVQYPHRPFYYRHRQNYHGEKASAAP